MRDAGCANYQLLARPASLTPTPRVTPPSVPVMQALLLLPTVLRQT